jgi:hypothetical protein
MKGLAENGLRKLPIAFGLRERILEPSAKPSQNGLFWPGFD